MATMLPSEEKGKHESLIGLETARRVLKERVSELRTSIQKIEQELSTELDRLEKEHTEKQSEYTNKMSSLTAIRASIEDQFKSGDFEDLKLSVLSDTDKKMETLEREYPPHSVELVWEDRVGEQLKKIGSVVVSVGRSEEKKECKLDNYTPDPIPVIVDTSVKLTAVIHSEVTADTTDYRLRRKPVKTVILPGCEFPHGLTYNYMDNEVCVVDNLSQMLYIYSFATNTTRSSGKSNFIPSFFCVDSTGRFLITDKREPYIYVFNKVVYAKQALETRLELEHGEDRLVEPRGVCLDREGRVIVVCNYKDAMLQIF